MLSHKIERLIGDVKNYEWGKIGEKSEVALLVSAGQSNSKIEQRPYAELWVGTHPDGMTKLHRTNVTLSDYINEDKQTKRHTLPFIMKIMSINHALSLQVHPTKEQARRLHEKDPINYRDPNHKPELAYALNKFELLCGFRPLKELTFNIISFPELRFAMGTENCAQLIAEKHENNCAKFCDLLKKCFSFMLYQNQTNVNKILSSLMDRVKNGEHGCMRKDTVAVLLNLNELFPNDIACLSPLILNHIILQPGECVFYGAQEIHAYLSGECVECVSCSNNTIRAGLTKKFVDKQNLLNIVNYRMADPTSYYVWPKQPNGYRHIQEFVPDCSDFVLQCLNIEQQKDQQQQFPLDLPALECLSVLIIVEAENAICVGLGRNGIITDAQFHVNRGDIFFIPSDRIMRFLFSKGAVRGYRTYSFEITKQIDVAHDFLDERPRA